MQTPAFSGGGFGNWLGVHLAIFGAGMLGSRLSEEAVMAGAHVVLFDPDVGTVSNLGNQQCQPGRLKVESVRERCEAIRPGHLTPFAYDVRHANLRRLRTCPLWFDCTDDPNLAWRLTELSNGLGSYLIRCAVDGSGQAEIGRVLVSAGGKEHACQCCTYSLEDIVRHRRRTPCLGAPAATAQPTLAGGAIAAGTAGLALSLGQRLIAGKDMERILAHEFLLDWTNFQLLPLRVERCAECLTGHQVWEPIELGVGAADGTLACVFAAAEDELGARQLDIEPYLHPLNTQASCGCGAVVAAVGTDWAAPPACSKCASPTRWLSEVQVDRVTREQAAQWDILDTPLAELGIPCGAMLVARTRGRRPRHLLLR
jgi:hypothetical protein